MNTTVVYEQAKIAVAMIKARQEASANGRRFVVDFGVYKRDVEAHTIETYLAACENGSQSPHPFKDPYIFETPIVGVTVQLLITPRHDGWGVAVFAKKTYVGALAVYLSNGALSYRQLTSFLGAPDGSDMQALTRMSVCEVAMLLNVLQDASVPKVRTDGPKRRMPQRGAFTTMHLPPGYTTVIASSAPSEPKGGTHASPIPHTRRGHWVTRGGTTFWRRDALVNHKEGEPFVPTRSHYEVAA